MDVELKVGAIEESVTVSATPSMWPQRPVTVVTKRRSSRSLEPGRHHHVDEPVAFGAPQLDVGGSQSNQLPAMRVYGIATQATSWLVLDGVVTTDAGQTGGGGSYFDYASFEEARMQTIANDVETPNRGINLNLIVKSGGNDFHGDASWEQTSSTFASPISTTSCARRASTRPIISNAGFTAARTSAAASFATSCGSTAGCAAG